MKSSLEISPNFTISDIHMIREYNYEMTKDMTTEEMKSYYQKGSERFLQRMAELKNETNKKV